MPRLVLTAEVSLLVAVPATNAKTVELKEDVAKRFTNPNHKNKNEAPRVYPGAFLCERQNIFK
jgi:hypothetical protein